MPKIKDQVKAVKRKIRMPHITLNERVLSDIKGLNVDDEITLIVTAKVTDIAKEPDFEMEIDFDSNKERPKILKAGFEVTNVTKKK